MQNLPNKKLFLLMVNMWNKFREKRYEKIVVFQFSETQT